MSARRYTVLAYFPDHSRICVYLVWAATVKEIPHVVRQKFEAENKAVNPRFVIDAIFLGHCENLANELQA